MIVGIDFGAKLSGNTVICFLLKQNLHFIQFKKGENADSRIQQWIVENRPVEIGLDAPISLPSAYFGKGHDYMYRHADRLLNGMSPMFLGGLIARAMALKEFVEELGSHVIEVYPAAFVNKRYEDLAVLYKEDLGTCTRILKDKFEYKLAEEPVNWHQFDAWVCWIITDMFRQGRHESAGFPEEGLIYY